MDESYFVVIPQAITDLNTPHAFPRFCLLGTNIYGIFLSSHNKGRCRIISKKSTQDIKIKIIRPKSS